MTHDPLVPDSRGALIVFEGPDGVGKTTVVAAIAERCARAAIRHETLNFSGRQSGTLGNLVYQIHHEPQSHGLTLLTEAGKQNVHLADHVDTIERQICTLVAAGSLVILDRYWWSTIVYGRTAGVNEDVLQALIALERVSWGDVQPDTVIILSRATPIDRPDQLLAWRRLQSEYQRIAAEELDAYKIVVVENDGSIDEVVERVWTAIEECLNRAAVRPIQQEVPSEQLQLDIIPPQSVPISAPVISSHLAPAKTTVVFDTYWRFAAERQAVFFRRIAGSRPPFTADPVLGTYKFTNAYRASDRVSQFLIRSVIYRNDLPATSEDVVFRILLFKLFNKVETWTHIEERLGPVTLERYQFDQYDQMLTGAMEAGQSIYSAAYIMPPPHMGYAKKHQNHLRLLEKMMAGQLPAKLADCGSMQAAFDLMRDYPGVGDFLAYQFVTDINYSEVTNFSEMEFVVPGPGARDGIRKCFSDLGGLNEVEAIRMVADRQEAEFDRLGLRFQTLWGRRLQLIDCQNLFCEVDKYARVVHPEVAGRSGRMRIKQKFRPTASPIAYWFPPKWGINAVAEETGDLP